MCIFLWKFLSTSRKAKNYISEISGSIAKRILSSVLKLFHENNMSVYFKPNELIGLYSMYLNGNIPGCINLKTIYNIVLK